MLLPNGQKPRELAAQSRVRLPTDIRRREATRQLEDVQGGWGWIFIRLTSYYVEPSHAVPQGSGLGLK
jgi:hypothetical protein